MLSILLSKCTQISADWKLQSFELVDPLAASFISPYLASRIGSDNHLKTLYHLGMETDQHSDTIDLTGLPEPVASGIRTLVQALRQEHAAVTTSAERKLFIGRLSHLGLNTPTLEEFQKARHEMWSKFPREFPDSKGS